MIGRKVEMGRKDQRQRNVVESMGGHGVLGLQGGIIVMRVPVLANETVHGQPKIGRERIAFPRQSTLVGRGSTCR